MERNRQEKENVRLEKIQIEAHIAKIKEQDNIARHKATEKAHNYSKGLTEQIELMEAKRRSEKKARELEDLAEKVSCEKI